MTLRLPRSTRLAAGLAAFVLMVLAGATLCAADRPVHVFILSGQSNMARLDPQKSFVPELRALLPEATVAPLKVAVSGKPIRMWLPEWDRLATEAGIAQKSEQGPIYYRQILDGYKKLREQHGKIASVTFCWMQGERDAKSGLAGIYERALTQLIANLRRDLERPDLNVVIGRLSDHAPGGEYQAGWDTVRSLHVKIATNDPRGAWVDTDDFNDLRKNGEMTNDLHYTPDGYRGFGERLARQAVRLIRGEKPDSAGRPIAIRANK